MLPFTLVCVEWLPLFLLSCEEEGIQRFNPARKMKGVGGNGRGRRRRRAWIQSVSKVINLHSNPISLLPWRSHIICSTSKESNYRIAPSLTCSLILSFCSLPSMCDLLAVGDIPARKKRKEGRKKEIKRRKGESNIAPSCSVPAAGPFRRRRLLHIGDDGLRIRIGSTPPSGAPVAGRPLERRRVSR